MKKTIASIPELEKYIEKIVPANQEAMSQARARQDYRVKVPGSLGRLEDISIKIAGITGEVYGNNVDNQAIILMCADNGIVEEGVASAPQTVTLMQTINFTKKITGVGAQAKHFGIDLLPVDVGVKLPIPEEYLTEDMSLDNKVVNRRIASGTRNFLKEPAMTREEAIAAVETGIESVEACAQAGKNLLGVGEMGIGNTTTASAIIAAKAIAETLTENPGEPTVPIVDDLLDQIVGRGGGLSDGGLARKKEVIKEGIEKYWNNNIAHDPIELLRCLGGLDIAAMTGTYLGAAMCKIPVVIDGVISIAAALLAIDIAPAAKDYMFTSHRSKEGGYGMAAKLLGIEPMYDLDMRLGEGSGCPIAFKIIEAACAVINNMKSLEEAQVDGDYLDQFREDGQFQ